MNASNHRTPFRSPLRLLVEGSRTVERESDWCLPGEYLRRVLHLESAVRHYRPGSSSSSSSPSLRGASLCLLESLHHDRSSVSGRSYVRQVVPKPDVRPLRSSAVSTG